MVERCLRVRAPSIDDATEALRLDGLWSEAMALESDGLLSWASEVVCADGFRFARVVTAASDCYPSRLRSVLGASAPPAIWVHGAIPFFDDGVCVRPLPCLAVVGSREVSKSVRSFAEEVGAEARRLGYVVVSGGAKGCDRAAVRGACSTRLFRRGARYVCDRCDGGDARNAIRDGGRAEIGCAIQDSRCRIRSDQGDVGDGCDRGDRSGCAVGTRAIEVLPFGIEVWMEYAKRVSIDLLEDHVCRLSVCGPGEVFSTATAMERNALIYAMSDAAVIVHARFKTGGTWHGAVEAHRRRLTKLIVRKDERDAAHRAMVGLGAVALDKPEGLSALLRGDGSDRCDGGDRCGGGDSRFRIQDAMYAIRDA